MIEGLFIEGVQNIRKKEVEIANYTKAQFAENQRVVKEKVAEIVAAKG
jgi:hypothetical protein